MPRLRLFAILCFDSQERREAPRLVYRLDTRGAGLYRRQPVTVPPVPCHLRFTRQRHPPRQVTLPPPYPFSRPAAQRVIEVPALHLWFAVLYPRVEHQAVLAVVVVVVGPLVVHPYHPFRDAVRLLRQPAVFIVAVDIVRIFRDAVIRPCRERAVRVQFRVRQPVSDIINYNQKTIRYTDIIFYFRTLKEIRLKYPFKELESLFDPLNIYPFYYFMPFLFISDLHDKGQYIERIRYVGIISTLIARRAILTDLFVDEQYEQLISRNMGDLKKEYLGYYLQIIDVEINNIASKIFIEPSSFYAFYNRRFNEYVNTMLMEKDISPLIGMDEEAFKRYAVGKSILHLLVSDMVLHIIKKQELTHQFDNMMKSFIMYLTLQDDVLDIMEDIQKQQPSHFYPWISDGKIIESIDENVEKAVLLKFYLGGGIERCEDLINKYVKDIITAVKKINHPLKSWLEVIERMSLKTKDKLDSFKVVRDKLHFFLSQQG